MGFSLHWGLASKAFACACLGVLLSGPGPAAAFGRAGPAGARIISLPRPQPRALPSVRGGGDGRRLGDRRLRRGYGGLGVAGLGLDAAGYGLDAGDGLDGGYGAPPAFGPDAPPLPPPPFLLRLPPACPLIIKVGRGLTHAVKTQVVYGRPVCRP